MQNNSIMIQGTSSDAGKSTVVAGLCRILYRRGVKVAPFKPQNMALNSAVTPDGREIGRAQAFQAMAAKTMTHSDMNPILIKPNSDTGAQIVINGLHYKNMDACEYHLYKPQARTIVVEAFRNLSLRYEHTIIEGAGSPAEINLRDNDIANMGFAEAIDCPVILVGDIDRGGVFAQFIGTLECLSKSERDRITGFIINRFRGDQSLLQPGIDWLEKRTGKPVFGVIPFLHGIHVAAEDAIHTHQALPDKYHASQKNILKIIVPAIPHISNHTDFDPLRLHPNVDLEYIGPDQDIPGADIIILPGSKTVRQDFEWLKDRGWVDTIFRHLRLGGKLIGICGGYQMLGNVIHDPHGIEGAAGSTNCLGLVNMETSLRKEKTLRHATGTLCFDNSCVNGYEIHAGITTKMPGIKPLIHCEDQQHAISGAVTEDNQCIGTYLHGLFDSAKSCNALLRWGGISPDPECRYSYEDVCERTINRIADTMENHLDIDALLEACNSTIVKVKQLPLHSTQQTIDY